ncbi:hypothetical protein [Streptomyces sp. NPDC054865]
MDAWYRTNWTFRWEGGPFDAVGTVDGRLKGVYTGGSPGFANHKNLTDESDRSQTRYTATVDLDGVTDLEQHRTCLMTAPATRSGPQAGGPPHRRPLHHLNGDQPTR